MSVLDLNEEESMGFNVMEKCIKMLFTILVGNSNNKKLEILSADDIISNYDKNKTSFLILAPVKERISIKICHGSHRINYSYGKGDSGKYGTVH